MRWGFDLGVNNPEIVIVWREGVRLPIEKRITVDSLMLENFARQGSGRAREFLRNLMIDQMVEPLLDFVLSELVAREQNDREREKFFGPGPLTVESMNRAVEKLIERRRYDQAE